MRIARWLALGTLAWLAATAAATPPARLGPLIPRHPTFQSYAQLFAWIASDRGLGDPLDQKLLGQIQADSYIDHVSDRAGPILVVRAELIGPDGRSRARSPAGNSPFYVLRQTGRGMVLLGRMFGLTYTSHWSGRSLDFDVQLQRSTAGTVQMHFRVKDNTLVNLSPPARRFEDVIARRAGAASPSLA